MHELILHKRKTAITIENLSSSSKMNFVRNIRKNKGSLSPTSLDEALSLRCGSSDVNFDLTRSRIAIESIQGYVVIAALFMNAALRLFGSAPKKIQPNPDKKKSIKTNNIATYIFILSTALSVLAGVFTSTVFSLLSLYSKTALARSLDDKYLAFYERTHDLRRASFHSMILQLLTFSISFVMVLFLNMSGKSRFIVAAGACSALIFIWSNVSKVMTLASELIFS